MKAETLTLTITIRPRYADAATTREEIAESLSWLTDAHTAFRLDWGEVGVGAWPEDEDGEGDTTP